MPYLFEMIAGAVLLLALIIYMLNTAPKYRARKQALLDRFTLVRKQSLNLQNTITDYIMKHDAVDEKFTDDMTYGQFLKYLKKNHISYLSEKKYIKLKTTNNRLYLRNTGKMLDEQGATLAEMEKQFEVSKK